MLDNIMFGCPDWVIGKPITMYTYANVSGNCFINTDFQWLKLTVENAFTLEHIIFILSHETLHKVLFKLEGKRAFRTLDKWCKHKGWIYFENTGICI